MNPDLIVLNDIDYVGDEKSFEHRSDVVKSVNSGRYNLLKQKARDTMCAIKVNSEMFLEADVINTNVYKGESIE